MAIKIMRLDFLRRQKVPWHGFKTCIQWKNQQKISLFLCFLSHFIYILVLVAIPVLAEQLLRQSHQHRVLCYYLEE
jgi:hypothetical protein